MKHHSNDDLLPDEFSELFGTLKRPPRELTGEQEAGLALLNLVRSNKE